MLSFDNPFTLFIVIALAAWGGRYVFKLVRLGATSRSDAASDELAERTQRLLETYRRQSGKRPE